MIGRLLDRLAARQRRAAGIDAPARVEAHKRTIRAAVARQRTALDALTYSDLNRAAFGRNPWPRDEEGRHADR